MTEDFRIRDAVSSIFWEEMDRISTFFPGVIIREHDNGLVDVQPSVKIRFPLDDEDTQMPVINNCVLMNLRSESAIIRFPKEKLKGSKVGVLVSQHSLEDWRENGGEPALPTEGRRFNFNDAVAILGLYPETKPWKTTQKPNTLEVQTTQDTKISIGHTKEGYELFNLLYNLLVELNKGLSTGTFNGAAGLVQIQTALAKMTNISTIPT